jgi:hypothetical protein
MPYWEVVTRSFRIAWDHKYLWLIALFSGEAGGFSFSYGQQTTQTTDVGRAQQQVTTWLSDHAGLVLVIGIVWLVVAIAFFILAAVCEGATVRASAEHDAGRPFGLRQAWTMGVHTMWVIVRFRLLLVLLYLPLVVLFVAWVVWLLITIAGQNASAVPGVFLTLPILVVVFIVYAIYVFFLDRFGSRAVILEERKAIPAIRRANSLLFKRFGRALLVWLLSIAVAFVVGVLLLCVSALVVLPLFVAIAAAGSSGSPVVWVVLVVAVIVLLPLYLLISAFLGAQGSTYWTLAFRRLDVDYAPAYGYPYPAIPPAAPAPPPPPPT